MFTDPLEELCLKAHISLRTAMRLAIVTAPGRFSNVDEILEHHLVTYKHVCGYKMLPPYIKRWTEKSLESVRARECPAHA